jgi:hypothetical protein
MPTKGRGGLLNRPPAAKLEARKGFSLSEEGSKIIFVFPVRFSSVRNSAPHDESLICDGWYKARVFFAR